MCRSAMVSQNHTAYFDIRIWGNRNAHLGGDILITACKFRGMWIESHILLVRRGGSRLVTSRPQLTCLDILNVYPRTIVIQGGIRPPASEIDFTPTAVTAPGSGN